MTKTSPAGGKSGHQARASIGARRNPASQAAILDAAEAILREEGLAGFSIEAVARRARAGKPTIYRWWPSRAALILEVYQRFKQAVGFPDTGALRTDLIAFLSNNLVGFWQSGMCGTVFRSVIAEAQTTPEAAAALAAYESARRRDATLMIERAKARGEVTAQTNSLLVVDLLVAFAWHRLLNGRLAETPADIEAVADLLIAGMQKPPASA